MDSKFYYQALQEWIDADPTTRGTIKFHELKLRDMSLILQRAQELKDLACNRVTDESNLKR